MNKIGERIKEFRINCGLTQQELAYRLGVAAQSVSKWERGVTMPDITLIVPLAKIFGVTSDELLGMAKTEADKQKAEYDRLYDLVHTADQYETASRAMLDYPDEMKYLRWKADCIYMRAYDEYTTQENFLDEIENACNLYKLVFENANGELRNEALASIVMSLAVLKRNEEAKKYALMYPETPVIDRDTLLGYVLTGDEKLKHSQNMILKHLDALISVMTNIRDKIDPNKNELKYLLCAADIINTFFPTGDYNILYDQMMIISIYKAIIYQYEDKEKALTALKNARKYAARFDSLFMGNPARVKFNSPFLSLLEFDSQELVTYGPREENKRIDIFRSWLDGACFDTLREYEGFVQLYNSER